jgi:hypothetical protein
MLAIWAAFAKVKCDQSCVGSSIHTAVAYARKYLILGAEA